MPICFLQAVRHRWVPEECEAACPEGLEADSLPHLTVIYPTPGSVSQQTQPACKKRRSSAGSSAVRADGQVCQTWNNVHIRLLPPSPTPFCVPQAEFLHGQKSWVMHTMMSRKFRQAKQAAKEAEYHVC